MILKYAAVCDSSILNHLPGLTRTQDQWAQALLTSQEAGVSGWGWLDLITALDPVCSLSLPCPVDVAHAFHPNKQGKSDITNKPVLGQGFCIKEACSQSYATDAEAVAIVCQICERMQIPYQKFVNRSDIRGGGTLGSIASTLLPVKTVDIGVPILAMHSVRELMGAKDMESLTEAVTAFFSL